MDRQPENGIQHGTDGRWEFLEHSQSRNNGLHVSAHNTGAQAPYEQLGFTETGRNLAKDL
ncbi:hypothetical protein GCM10023322_31960 [Rugosimonospora acidiphila]|uniref:Beta-galactosidase n=1 Tax=Rugosimonospora acidiphila TaxID=556531 RepID=A0ABP9RTN6_9ACTN